MPEKKIHLLSTGSLQIPRIWLNGKENIQLDVLPFIRIEESMDTEQIRHIRQWAKEKHTVIFTSKQAVRIVAAVVSRIPLWTIYCINGATKREILTWWREASILDTAPNGKELAEKIIGAEKTEAVLFFCSAQRLNEIPSCLQANQIPFTEVRIYETIPTPVRIEQKYQGLFFFSPSAVHSFFSLNNADESLFFSIGPTTTAALEEYIESKQNIITAPRPSKLKMVETAIQYFQKHSDE